MDGYTIRYVGDQALSVEFENEISLAVNRKVVALARALEARKLPGVGELVPTYRALLVHYDSLCTNLSLLERVIGECIATPADANPSPAIVTEIPVLYDGADLAEIARLERKSEEEVIRIHSGSDYYVYMLGFAPGHSYAARMENLFSFKRRAEPRVRIPGGSIVVQLGLSDIIPFPQPCGWNIIGTTPVLACDYRKENPFLLRAGQWIRHVPVDRAEFEEIRRQVELGEYECRSYKKVPEPEQ